EKRRFGDRFGAALMLGALSDLAYRQEDLVGAQHYAAEQGKLAQQLRAVLVGATALQRQARLLSAGIRLDLARLGLFAGQPAEAEHLAGEVAQWYGQRGLSCDQARALAVQAEALVAVGRPGPASEAANRAASLAQPSENPDLQIFVTTAG